MTTEQKAKAYDEALEKAREISQNPNSAFCGEVLSKIFPELKESDDERIRKTLYGWVCSEPDSTFDEGYSKKDILAWLEKQKSTQWSEEDENMLNDIILDLRILKHKDAGKEGKAAYQKEIDWLQSLSPNQK